MNILNNVAHFHSRVGTKKTVIAFIVGPFAVAGYIISQTVKQLFSFRL
jgi:uroporphyrinogen-III decarboxylase